MPGHMLHAQCPCGFQAGVSPGLADFNLKAREGRVIAYDPEKPGLLTVNREDAAKRALVTIEDPYLKHYCRSVFDPEVAASVQGEAFACPQCREVTMRFAFAGFWD